MRKKERAKEGDKEGRKWRDREEGNGEIARTERQEGEKGGRQGGRGRWRMREND